MLWSTVVACDEDDEDDLGECWAIRVGGVRDGDT